MNKPRRIYRYDSIEKLIAKFFGCPISRIHEYVVGTECDRGFTQKNNIYVWVGEDTPLEMVVRFMGHEIGHLNGKKYKQFHSEEKKAKEFEDVSVEAYVGAYKLMGKKR